MEETKINESQLKARKTTLLKKSVDELVDVIIKKDDDARKFVNRINKLKDNIRGLENKIDKLNTSFTGERTAEVNADQRVLELSDTIAGLNNENAELIKLKKGLDDQLSQLNQSMSRTDKLLKQNEAAYTKAMSDIAEINAKLYRSRSAFKTALSIMLIETIILVICIIF